jgi:hypothetical protein
MGGSKSEGERGRKTGRGGGDEKSFLAAGKGRPMQKRAAPERKLFEGDLKEAFLDSLACTANVVATAAAVGVDESTVYRHRRTDPEFRAGFWAAMEAACAKLAALRLQREIERAERAAADGGAGVAAELAGLDGPPDARQIADLVKLMQALRDLTRNLAGEPKSGRPPANAGMDEMCAVLSARLDAFGKRERAREAAAAAEAEADAAAAAAAARARGGGADGQAAA